MNSLLEKIISNKKDEIGSMFIDKKRNRKIHHLKNHIKDNFVNIIAEIKSSSPSAGLIREINLDEILPVYEKYASAISVLTDERFFGGSFERLCEVAERVELPVLCKDFIIDKKQIDMAYSYGADIVLLIVRILSDETLGELYQYAKNFGLDVLVELHSIEDMQRIISFSPDIVGVNARDLDTLEISLKRAKTILNSINFETLKIAESGIKTKQNIEYLRDDCDAFLIGEVLLKESKNMERKFIDFIE